MRPIESAAALFPVPIPYAPCPAGALGLSVDSEGRSDCDPASGVDCVDLAYLVGVWDRSYWELLHMLDTPTGGCIARKVTRVRDFLQLVRLLVRMQFPVHI